MCVPSINLALPCHTLKSQSKLQISAEMMLAENPKVFPIEAGYEPVDFITLFPFWTEREDVKRYGNKVRNRLSFQLFVSSVSANIQLFTIEIKARQFRRLLTT